MDHICNTRHAMSPTTFWKRYAFLFLKIDLLAIKTLKQKAICDLPADVR